MIHHYPIVGMFYRKPAKALVSVLAIGTELTLRAEPDNPADHNAIAVWLRTASLGEAALAELDMQLAGYGMNLPQLLERDEWQLGYVPAPLAATLRANDKPPVGEDVIGHFVCAASGSPQIEVDW